MSDKKQDEKKKVEKKPEEKKKVEKKPEARKPSIGVALIPVAVIIVALFYALVIHKTRDPQIPLIIGAVAATIVGIRLGYTWEDLEKGFIETISLSMQACLILMVIGSIIGIWLAAGTVPTMIYYGLKIITPSAFLVTACLLCCVVSVSTGSSWSTAGTVGVALIAIGTGLGIPPPMSAGAIVSGAYFGDKMSPLSDTTNLAPAMAGTSLFSHVGHMIYTTGAALLISLVVYFILGLKFRGQAIDKVQLDGILTAIDSNYYISPVLLVPALVVITLAVMRFPAIPGLICGMAAGFAAYLIFQKGSLSLDAATGNGLNILMYGNEMETGHEMVDSLINGGGMQSMMWTVSLILCAMVFGGIMEKTGCLGTLTDVLLKAAKSTGGLTLAVVLSCIVINLITGDQYLSIVIPGRMFKEEYTKRGLHPKNLSRSLEDAGTVTSALIPWNTCGAFMSNALKVPAHLFAPYAVLNYASPIISVVYGYLGITMTKMTDEQIAAMNRGEIVA